MTKIMEYLKFIFVLSALSPATAEMSEGMKLLNKIINNDTLDFCTYIECIEPLTREECPDGTSYFKGVKQFGCCGGCVRFKQIGDSNCTGPTPVDEITEGFFPSHEEQLYENTNIVNSTDCEVGLVCSNGTCVADPNQPQGCRYVRDKYDEMYVNFTAFRDDYRWRPQCTSDGKYDARQCKGPSDAPRCFCVDPEGETIFGSAFYEEKEMYAEMNCACSREVWRRLSQGDTSVTLHCQANGNYEELQCDGGWCHCMDTVTVKPYGASLPEALMAFLPCYNKTLTGEQYLRRCESEFHAHMALFEALQGHGTDGPTTRLRCDPDGSYSAEQCDYDMCRCYDRYMIQSTVSRGGCKCARDRWFFKANQLNVEIDCKHPDGGEAGTYALFQKRGLYTYCADEDGVRAGPLVCSQYESKLNCEMAQRCQNGEESIGQNGEDTDDPCEMVCDDCPDEAYAANNVKCRFDD